MGAHSADADSARVCSAIRVYCCWLKAISDGLRSGASCEAGKEPEADTALAYANLPSRLISLASSAPVSNTRDTMALRRGDFALPRLGGSLGRIVFPVVMLHL